MIEVRLHLVFPMDARCKGQMEGKEHDECDGTLFEHM